VESLNAIRLHYESALETGGDSGQKVGWRDSKAQELRFEAISRILNGVSFSTVSDFGCGTGDLLMHLRAQGWTGNYRGADISTKMVAEGTSRFYLDHSAQFEVSASPPEAQTVIASGIFNVCTMISDDDWHAYCCETISQMWRSSSKAMVFNMLSIDSHADRRKSGLAYMNPSEWLSYCRTNFSSHVRLDQSYGQFDFTIAVFHHPPVVRGSADSLKASV
jgi:SAM-dependent methyltransferase